MKHSIIITGAGGGIGRAIALRFARANYCIVACDKNPASLQNLAQFLSESLEKKLNQENLTTHVVDVSSFTDVEMFFKQLSNEKKFPTCLVNNAGIYIAKNILDYSAEEIDRVIDVNYKGAVYCSQHFARRLLRSKSSGVIINISSVSGQEGSSDALYGSSKAALLGLTKSCAMNFSPFIRVNALTPGVVETDMMKAIPEWRLKEYRETELIKNPIEPEDIANTVWFLAGSEGAHYTGAVFNINNGCFLG